MHNAYSYSRFVKSSAITGKASFPEKIIDANLSRYYWDGVLKFG
jgi:hypothetical protein